MQSVELLENFGRGKVGIATVLFESGRVLPDFLESLRNQTYTNWMVYAVDNASSDDCAEMCRAEGERFVVTRNDSNTGFAWATNQGIRQAIEGGCEYVLLLNNDVLFREDFLTELLSGLRRTGADLVAPLTYYFDDPNVIWAAGGKLQRLLGNRPVHLGQDEVDCRQFSSDRPIEFAPGSAILVKREVFVRVGLLDEVYFTYWEDTDFALRTFRAGLRTFLIPSAKMWHKVSSLAGKGSAFQRYYAVRNHALYIRKHCTPFAAAMLSFIYLSVYRTTALLGIGDPARVRHWNEGLRLGAGRRNV